jgi:hypothetical protein
MSFEMIIHITIDIVITGVILFYLRLGVKRVVRILMICQKYKPLILINIQ